MATILKSRSLASYIDAENGTVSRELYVNSEIFEQEMEQIFGRMWLFIGHESQIPKAGDFVRGRMGTEQVIVTRARDMKIHILLNSCAHRGNMVCRYDEGNALGFQCSFHGWTFGSDGGLINLPPATEEDYAQVLHKEDGGMLRARVETFQGTIWANWDQSAPSFIDYLGGVELLTEAAKSVGKRNDSPTRLRVRQIPDDIRSRKRSTVAWD